MRDHISAVQNACASLDGIGAELSIELRSFKENELFERRTRSIRFEGKETVNDTGCVPIQPITEHFSGTRWEITGEGAGMEHEALGLSVSFKATDTAVSNVGVALSIRFTSWNERNSVFFPAAAYRGNRFRAFSDWRTELPFDISPSMPPTIPSHVPHLAIGEGPSDLRFRTTDCSTPAMGIFFPNYGRGFLLFTSQANRFGNFGLQLEESDDRETANASLTSPSVKPGAYRNGKPRSDRGANLMPGDSIQLECRIVVFSASDHTDFYRFFFNYRSDTRGPVHRRNDIPFSSVRQIQLEKYERQNWVDAYGYYAVGMRESKYQDWQSGWVGGTNTLYALLAEKTGNTRKRALRTFSFLQGGLTTHGLLKNGFYDGSWFIGRDERYVFLRYTGDSLYFLAKSLLVLELDRSRDPASVNDETIQTARYIVRSLADGLHRLWLRYGQFGYFVDNRTGRLAIGGSCAAALAPGGLALAARALGECKYLPIAEASADAYYREYVAEGFTNGGPGDIFLCPDSESVFGLLESFATLYESTGDGRWIAYARAAAYQAATWTTSEDFSFPPESTFAKLDMRTTGTVWANIQNKHAAPGICTLSGIGLLILFRATGETRFIQLLSEIAHAIPQYMSRADRPIIDRRPRQRWQILDQGWINERVNISDWEVRGEPEEEIGVGEVFGGSTWSESAMLLTSLEIPGIYLRTDTGFLVIIDHVEASVKHIETGALELSISNPTDFHASVTVLAEDAEEAHKPLGPTPMLSAPRIEIPAGSMIKYRLPLKKI